MEFVFGLLPLLVLVGMGFFCGANASVKTVNVVVGAIFLAFALALGLFAPILIPFALILLPPYYLGVFLGRKFERVAPAMDDNEFQYELLRQQTEQPRQYRQFEQ